MGWVWVVNPVNGLPHRLPDNQESIRAHLGRGYQLTDLPGDLDSDDPDFVELFEAWQAKKAESENKTSGAKSATKTKKEAE